MPQYKWVRGSSKDALKQITSRIDEFTQDVGIPYVFHPGIAQWPRLDEPDLKFAEAKKPKGEYTCKVKYGAQEIEDTNALFVPLFERSRELAEVRIREALTVKYGSKAAPHIKKALEELKPGQFFKPVLDTDTAEETGEGTRQFAKTAAYIDKKKDNKVVDLPPPAIFDAAGNPLKEHVGGGSKVIASVILTPWYMPAKSEYGVSTKFLAVQVIDLKRGGGARNSDDFGFDKQEGYTSSGDEEHDGDGSTDRDPTDF